MRILSEIFLPQTYSAACAEALFADLRRHFENPRYIAAWQAAADKLVPAGVPFEINLGAIFRGMRTTPYPSAEQIKYISSHSGKFILTSDSHSADTVARDFQKWETWAEGLGAEFVEL